MTRRRRPCVLRRPARAGGVVYTFSGMCSLPPHPLGVQPLGNRYLSAVPCAREDGLGHLALLPDEQLLALLERLSGRELAALSAASRTLYAWCTQEELWRAACLATWGGDLRYRLSWRATYRRRLRGRAASRAEEDVEEQPLAASICCRGVYSDLLFAPHRCAATRLPQAWLTFERGVPRVDASELSVDAFVARFENASLPVLITGCVQAWPAFAKWSAERLEASLGDRRVFAGGYAFALADYLAYARRCSADDCPLYLFDRDVLLETELGGDAPVPPYFAAERDHFSLLPAAERPDHAWLIAGGRGSGSSWHVDPNGTSAWNAVVRGSKKWLLSRTVPPGCAASASGAHVSSPTSLTDWMLNFYSTASANPACGGGGRCLECLCGEGELLFVPAGWWHFALNVGELTVAVTQNYVPDASLHTTLKLLASRDEELVSGLREPAQRRGLHQALVEALRRERPASLAAALARGAAPTKWGGDASSFAFNFRL